MNTFDSRTCPNVRPSLLNLFRYMRLSRAMRALSVSHTAVIGVGGKKDPRRAVAGVGGVNNGGESGCASVRGDESALIPVSAQGPELSTCNRGARRRRLARPCASNIAALGTGKGDDGADVARDAIMRGGRNIVVSSSELCRPRTTRTPS